MTVYDGNKDRVFWDHTDLRARAAQCCTFFRQGDHFAEFILVATQEATLDLSQLHVRSVPKSWPTAPGAMHLSELGGREDPKWADEPRSRRPEPCRKEGRTRPCKKQQHGRKRGAQRVMVKTSCRCFPSFGRLRLTCHV